jgi:hypothetical protein
MLASHKSPFVVEVHQIDYVQPKNLKQFVDKYLAVCQITRSVASDAIVEFAQDAEFGFNDALLLFNYAVVVRPLVGEAVVKEVIAKLPSSITSSL